jgi:hypothetical protein
MKRWSSCAGLRSAFYETALFYDERGRVWLTSIKLRGRWRDPRLAAIYGGYSSVKIPRRLSR